MLLVYIFLGLAGVILLFISIKGKNKRYSNLVNFLLTTVATLIGVIMAINVSVNNEMKKEKEDLVKILESGVFVIDKVSKYVESTDEKTSKTKKDTSENFIVEKYKKINSETNLENYKEKNNLLKKQTSFFDSIKKNIDSLKIVFEKNVVKPIEGDNDYSLNTILLGDVKLPFPDYIGSLLTNPDFLKGLSKKSLLTLNEDYINLQRTYEYNVKSDGDINFYLLALKKIKNTLLIETAFQEKRITNKQMNENFTLVNNLNSSELIYKMMRKKDTLENESTPMKQ